MMVIQLPFIYYTNFCFVVSGIQVNRNLVHQLIIGVIYKAKIVSEDFLLPVAN